MSGDLVIPTENDFKIARDGIEGQLKAFCPDMKSSDIKGFDEFIDHQIKVLAHERAYGRKLQEFLHPR